MKCTVRFRGMDTSHRDIDPIHAENHLFHRLVRSLKSLPQHRSRLVPFSQVNPFSMCCFMPVLVMVAVYLSAPLGCFADDSLPDTLKPSVDALVERFVPAETAHRMARQLIAKTSDIDSSQAILQAIRSAIDNGLPAQPMIDKVFEGLAKGVDNRRIYDAVQRVRNRYETAYHYTANHFSFSPHENKLIATGIAEAMASGMSMTEIDAMIRAAATSLPSPQKTPPLPTAVIQVLTTSRDLARLGIDPPLVARVLAESIRVNASVTDLRTLSDAFMACEPSISLNRLSENFVQSLQRETGKSNVSLADLFRNTVNTLQEGAPGERPGEAAHGDHGKGSAASDSGSDSGAGGGHGGDGGSGGGGGGGGGSGGGGGGGGGGR